MRISLNFILTLILLIFGYFAWMWTATVEIEPIKQKFSLSLHQDLSLFVMVGQSNMSGRGRMENAPNIITRHAFIFNNDDTWSFPKEPVDFGWNQVDSVSKDKSAGFSMGTAFIRALNTLHPTRAIGLIPCAKGGSTIEQWQKNLSRESLFGSCLRRINLASRYGKVTAVLFYQGESDALNKQKASDWGRLFKEFIADFRSALGNKNLPVVFAQLPRPPGEEYAGWETIKQQQERVELINVKMIPTTDLKIDSDAHLNNDGYLILGRRFAESLNSLEVTWAHSSFTWLTSFFQKNETVK